MDVRRLMKGFDTPEEAVLAYIELYENKSTWASPMERSTFKLKQGVSRTMKPGLIVRLQVATYLDEDKDYNRCVCYLTKFEDYKWSINACYLGKHSADDKASSSGTPTWLNLFAEAPGGIGHPIHNYRFIIGGEILSHEEMIHRVVLTSADGIQLESDVEDDLVLFWENRIIRQPFVANLYDSSGKILAQQIVTL